MRQAGILAAAGIYAFDHHIDRLKDDHRRAKEIGNVLSASPYLEWLIPVETNIIIFKLKEEFPADRFVQNLKENDILAIAIGKNQVRMVTHLDVDDAMVEKILAVLKSFK